MFQEQVAEPVRLCDEGRRGRTIKANVSVEGLGLLHVTTRDASGWWRPLAECEVARIYAWCWPPGERTDLSDSYGFAVESRANRPVTLVEATGDLGRVLRSYGQNLDQVLAELVEMDVQLAIQRHDSEIA